MRRPKILFPHPSILFEWGPKGDSPAHSCMAGRAAGTHIFGQPGAADHSNSIVLEFDMLISLEPLEPHIGLLRWTKSHALLDEELMEADDN